MRAIENGIERLVFWSRWIQAPMYLGLIIAGLLYCCKFFMELWHLLTNMVDANEASVMLGVLTLIDMVMVSNLLVMVIIGGYIIFVSRIDLDKHEDKPDWLEHIDAGMLKVKLAASLVSISGINLLKSFINSSVNDAVTIRYQIIIHVVFLFSTLILAYSEKIIHSYKNSS